jgi:ABC-type oligopeptide transport system substrate-binding subunit
MNRQPSNRLLSVRAALGLGIVLLVAGAWFGSDAGLWGRDGRGPGGERRAQKKKAPSGKRHEEEEEEDGPRKKRRPPPRVQDVGEKAPPAKPAEAPVTDLHRAAVAATHVAVRKLFRDLAVPHDVVTFRKYDRVMVGGGRLAGKTLSVEPLPEYIEDPRDWKGKITLHVLDPDGRRARTVTPSGAMVESIRYYETLAVEASQGFLDQHPEKPEGRLHLARFPQLVAAEQALAFVLRFHESARAREVRRGADWDKVERPLRKQLLRVSLLQVEELAEAKDWDQAFEIVRRLAETYPREYHEQVAKPLPALLRKALDDPTTQKARLLEVLRRLEELFPGSAMTAPVRDSLKKQARALLARAKGLGKGREKEALAILERAEKIYPQLPELQTYRMNLDNAYQVLRVGMRELPASLSPALACTDSELRAVELLFEGLVKLSPDAGGRLLYRPGLAEGRVRVLSLGREFKLPRDAAWSDGEPLSGPDVRRTVQLLQKGRGSGQSAAWGELLARVELGGDPYRVRLRLPQGFLDPLAPMSFKLLPAHLDPDSPKFAEEPVGSGPFRYAGRTVDPGRGEYAGFVANPYYGARRSKRNLPRMREVRIYAPRDPVQGLELGHIDLALDLTAEQAAKLRDKSEFVVPMPSKARPNRRIYFLAVNHRRAELARPEVRLALARAIPREKLLDECFRPGLGRLVHKALHGPYPVGSWACNPALKGRAAGSLDPYDPDLARIKLKPALKALGGPVRLTLKYPEEEGPLGAQLRKAMESLCAEVNKALPGLTLEPVALQPKDLRDAVEKTRDYHLAYYYYDFPDEACWLMPLLGPQGRMLGSSDRGGAENYMGYTGSLVGLVQTATGRRQFTQVREYTHAIHRDFLEKEMPFIPLWQLDPLCAYRQSSLEPGAFDPHLVFTDVERWKVTHKQAGGEGE